MPVPTLVTDLSTTLASNSPAGSDNVFPSLDDYLRALSGFVASIRDNSGNGWVSPYLPLAGGTVTGATIFSSTVALNGALSGTGLTTYLASPPAIGGTTPAAGSFTTLAASGGVTFSGGTANGVLYLNGSKVATSGSALQFNGTNFYTTAAIYGGAGSANANIIASSNVANGGAGFSQFLLGNTSTDTRGYLSYSHAADAMLFGVVGSEQMRLTSTGLGIGTSSPGFKLDVNGIGAVRAGNAVRYYRADNAIYTELYDAGASGFTLNNANGNGFRFQTSGSTQATLDSAGNFGLGVTPSAWRSGDRALDIGSTASLVDAQSANTRLYNNTFVATGGTNTYKITAAASYYDQGGGVHRWFNAASGTAGNAISFTQAMTLTAAGDLVVGTTSALSSATGRTDLTINGSSIGAIISFGNGGVRKGYIWQDGTDLYVTNQPSGIISFLNNGSERARITSAGDFIHQVNGTAPSLSTNSTMSFELTSNTSLKIVVRGTDGVTRSASLTLA